jgi:hypothetical protein
MALSEYEEAMKRRILKMIEEQPLQGAPSMNVYTYGAMPGSISEAMNLGGGQSTQKQMAATQAGISPEELEYLVDISKRDVKQNMGVDQEGNDILKTVGWDKKVHRYTVPKGSPQDHMAQWDEMDPVAGYAESGEGGIGRAGTKPSLDKKKKNNNSLW